MMTAQNPIHSLVLNTANFRHNFRHIVMLILVIKRRVFALWSNKHICLLIITIVC